MNFVQYLMVLAVYINLTIAYGEPCGIGRSCPAGACLGKRGEPVDGIIVKRGTCVNGL